MLDIFNWATTIVFTHCLMAVAIGVIIAFVMAIGWLVRKLVNTFRKLKKN